MPTAPSKKFEEGEVYYWPPGHTVSVDQDYHAIAFSPREEMGELIKHLNEAGRLKHESG